MCLKFEKFEALCAYKPRAYKKKSVRQNLKTRLNDDTHIKFITYPPSSRRGNFRECIAGERNQRRESSLNITLFNAYIAKLIGAPLKTKIFNVFHGC